MYPIIYPENLCFRRKGSIPNIKKLYLITRNHFGALRTVLTIYTSITLKISMFMIIRGGIEDTRLEAKAKNTKKIRGQGQGQPFRGQTLSRPRTGMLVAKDTSASALQNKKKKRSSQNFFQKIFQGLHKILTIQKIVLPRAEDRPIFEDLRPRGQCQGLDLRR